LETHHHSKTEKKRWTHYIWEFVMLFLAVFAGFVAENLRENFVERKREKQYILSLVDDLEKDTAIIYRISRINIKMARGQDSLIELMNNRPDTGDVSKKAYRYYFIYTTNFPQVEFNERTMSQLLNAGNMRLIEDRSISDSIMAYSISTKYVKEQGKAYEEYFKKTLDLSSSVFDFTYARADLHEDFSVTPKISKLPPKLLTSDPVVLKKYAISLALSKAILQQYILNLKQIKDKAVALKALLRREYHLKDEKEEKPPGK